jgi:hypothetical protein
VRDLREPLREPLVDVIGQVLGLAGADIVAEGHACGDDQAVRPSLTRATTTLAAPATSTVRRVAL